MSNNNNLEHLTQIFNFHFQSLKFLFLFHNAFYDCFQTWKIIAGDLPNGKKT
jgi:hypothetical protein